MDEPDLSIRDVLLVAAVVAVGLIVGELVTDLWAARRGGVLARQSAEYLAVRDATTDYLDRLHALARKE